MTTTPKRLSDELHQLRWSLHYIVEDAPHAEEDDADRADRWTDLVIVDQADRLKFPTLEQPRDVYDRGQFGVVLIISSSRAGPVHRLWPDASRVQSVW